MRAMLLRDPAKIKTRAHGALVRKRLCGRAPSARSCAVQHQRVLLDLVAVLRGDSVLQFFDLGAGESITLPCRRRHVVVVLAAVES